MDEREDIRLGGFRQLKRDIRGSREYVVVGIDEEKGDVGSKTTLRDIRDMYI